MEYKTYVIDHNNGHKSTYKLVDVTGFALPIAFDEACDDTLINRLILIIQNRRRVKFNFGDRETGKSWNEEHDTVGTIGLSKGQKAYFPILIKSERSHGGGTILTGRILRIRDAKSWDVLYEVPNMVETKVEIGVSEFIGDGHTEYRTIVNGEIYGMHNSLAAAKRVKKLIEG